MFSVPSVTMNGGSRTLVTSSPLAAPASAPTPRPSRIASGPGTPESKAVLAITIDENTMMAPQDRSMPAVRMISVWPTASAPTTATCWVMSDRLLGVANLLFSMLKTMTLMTSTIAGLSHG